MSTETFETPEMDTLQGQDAALLPASWARAPWVYLHNVMLWECIFVGKVGEERDPTKYEWLPVLGRQEGQPGANGVTINPETKRLNFAGAIAGHASIKNFAIEPSDPRLRQFRFYNAKFFKCEQGKKRYVEPGERLTKLSNGNVLPRTDYAIWYGFLRHLKANGLIQAMQVEVYDVFVAQLRNRINSLKRLSNRKASLEEAEFKLKCFEAAWAKETAAVTAEEPELEVELDAENVAEGMTAKSDTVADGVVQPKRRNKTAAEKPQATRQPRQKPPKEGEA
jgi:hypothetical protein